MEILRYSYVIMETHGSSSNFLDSPRISYKFLDSTRTTYTLSELR